MSMFDQFSGSGKKKRNRNDTPPHRGHGKALRGRMIAEAARERMKQEAPSTPVEHMAIESLVKQDEEHEYREHAKKQKALDDARGRIAGTGRPRLPQIELCPADRSLLLRMISAMEENTKAQREASAAIRGEPVAVDEVLTATPVEIEAPEAQVADVASITHAVLIEDQAEVLTAG